MTASGSNGIGNASDEFHSAFEDEDEREDSFDDNFAAGVDSHSSRFDATDQPQANWPTTVDEVVDRILAEMSDADKERVRSMPKDDLIQFHFGWGMGIRNAFGLWGGNAALMQSCAQARGYPFPSIHPDEASSVIIEAVWERLQ